MASLTVVLFGNSTSIQFGQDNILLGEEPPPLKDGEFSRIDPVRIKILEHHVSVINMIDFTKLHLDSVDHPISQLVQEYKICTFIFVLRLGQLTDDDKMGLEWLQTVFGDRVFQFVMILFTYDREEESDTIIDDLKKNSVVEQLVKKCRERYYICSKTMNKQSEMRELRKKIDCLFNENQSQHYTSEMYNTQLQERENQRKNNQTINEEPIAHTDAKTQGKHREENKDTGTGVIPDQHLQQEKIRKEKIENLLQKLHLKDGNQNTLRAAEVLQISLQSCAEKQLVHSFLEQLLMMNYRARNIKIIETYEQHYTQQRENGSKICKGDFLTDMSLSRKVRNTDTIHPMDVQMAVFHCADSFLKQLMVTKLSQCQFALPLLVPDPFTQQIEFPLWTFRQINKSWKIRKMDNDIISKVQPVYKAETPMVSFFRFGSVSSSKSQLMNTLINEKHNTFFHRNCPGSSRTRLLMDGVVEIAWYCPSGQDKDTFTDCVAFCNIHGDAGDNEKQLNIITDMSSVNVVLLPQLDQNDRNMIKLKNLYSDPKPLICLFPDDESEVIETVSGKYKIGLKDRNQSDVSEELRRAINDCLLSSASAFRFRFRLEDVSKHSKIRVDEELDEDCKRGREAAQQMMKLMKNKNLTEIKESFLPCQGELWHLWCQKNKELHRPQGNDVEQEISKKQTEMKKIREDQHESVISEPINFFITQNANRMFFLKWLKILLDEFTSADLSALHNKYDQTWSTVLKLKDNNAQSKELKDAQIELEEISKELQAAAFGLEHIMREIAQIYESCSCLNKNKQDLQLHFSSLPSLAAEMMMSGFPLELMDGDAAHVPLIWITAVLDQLIQKLGDQRVFVLSVLGIQSSGKSTMLNAMFGLEFAVSAGRCTRGAFMQLLRMSEEMKHQIKFDYILVVDTEGLRSLEFDGRSTRHHDNELATFVVGLGHLTLINILGENHFDMQDILQIIVQAFLRMKKVKLNPSCMFVHQNVTDVTAGEKNMEGRRRLVQILDEMTKLAAKEEDSNAECFSDVIHFDIRKDVRYFAHLWEGNPPMAPQNPNYCENIQELKETIISQTSKSTGMTLRHLCERIKNLWEALLNERFVFSFKNSLEISTYRRLETEYSKWTWSLRSAMLEIENKLQNKIENEAIHKVEVTELERELKGKSEEVEKSVSDFFEKDTDADILIQWKMKFEIKIKELQENIIRETRRKLNDILQQRDLKKKIDAQKTLHENTLFEKSKDLALKHKDKANDKELLKREFYLFWEECVKEISTDCPPIKDIDILKDVKIILNDVYKSVPVEHRKKNRNIFTLQNYSDYVQFNKSRGLAGPIKNLIKTAKLSGPLSENKNRQIKTLVDDISQQTDAMIQSFNMSKMGYNISYIQKLMNYIKERITEYEEGPVKYVFSNEFFVDLVFSIMNRANTSFSDQHIMFREANDPVLYLKEKRNEYYSVFQKYCQGAKSAVIFGEIICQKLKTPIEQSVYQQTARDSADEIRSNCPSLNGNRSNLEKHILRRLAEDNRFYKYLDYFFDPKEQFKSFIRDEVSKYIRDQFQRSSVHPKMDQNIYLLQKKIMTAAHESTKYAQMKSGDVDLWLMFFTQKLSNVLVFSVRDFSGVKRDDVKDFKLLEEVVQTQLTFIMSVIRKEFSADTFNKKLDLKNRPDEILIDHFCQCCWVQCPFCKAVCTNTIENHDGDHSVPFHRVIGLKGWFYTDTTNLSINICSSSVAGDGTFHPKTSKKSFHWRQYRKAGGLYSKWSITPDLSELPYWKWVVCRFQNNLEEHYSKTFLASGKIPDEWKKITREEAIKSLDTYI